jgi:hypothetical protein
VGGGERDGGKAGQRDRPHRASWTNWTAALIGGLAVVTALAVTVAVLLARARRAGMTGQEWEHDWLGDVVLLCARLPVVRRWATEPRAAWVRGHALIVFLALSALAGAAEITGMVIGEHWTDPLLIGWAIIVAGAGDLAFCVISNAVAGFIARPPRRRGQRVTETAVVAGCVAVLIAVAFRASIWCLGSRHPLDAVVPVVALTLGAGVAAAAITAVIAFLRTPPRPSSGSASHAPSPTG